MTAAGWSGLESLTRFPCQAAFLNLAHLRFCAAAILARASALMVHFLRPLTPNAVVPASKLRAS